MVWKSEEVTGQERGKGARYGAKQGKDFVVSRRSPRARSSPLFAAPRPGSMETADSQFLSDLARECFKQRASQKTGCRQANNQGDSAASGLTRLAGSLAAGYQTSP